MPSPPTGPVSEVAALAHAVAPAPRKARFWDRIAVKYAAGPIADMAGYELTLRRVQDLLSTDKDVLEIGCGTGTTALRLAPCTRRLLATDVSAGMIAIAREKLAAQPLPQLSFAVADANAAVAGAGEYDVVLAFNLLHLVADLDRALESAVQTLRPGGMRVIGKAPHVLSFDADALQSAIARQGMDIVSVERHGTKGKDARVFIVARKAA
jgi:ubiquinone/menaquinone biosynthesis C-methylase UbiE